ncbi:MAG TPA: NUDIX domain-containing protein [Pseudoxanthomonas sp.]|nr:NUDIX domain-containing protein [Pseudoxanthomonas sp.]
MPAVPGSVAMPALPLANERGERLLAIDPPARHPPAAPRFALVVGEEEGRVLLVFNVQRDVHELPGGWIDPGESAEACARRELLEESGHRAATLALSAWITLDIPDPGGGSERIVGAVFAGELMRAGPFTPTPEIAAVGFHPFDRLPAATSAIDSAVVAWHALARA